MNKSLKILWNNFLIGLARGFGLAVGMTVIVAVVAFILSKLVTLPLIGHFIAEIVKVVEVYLKEMPKH